MRRQKTQSKFLAAAINIEIGDRTTPIFRQQIEKLKASVKTTGMLQKLHHARIGVAVPYIIVDIGRSGITL